MLVDWRPPSSDRISNGGIEKNLYIDSICFCRRDASMERPRFFLFLRVRMFDIQPVVAPQRGVRFLSPAWPEPGPLPPCPMSLPS